ncbi:MAG: aspartyl-tRNA(Asn)/glutamyl-tRNA(Gln) amidotransferase subunit A [Verrucomicrobiales bacterium]|jgi:aspartyl-tRNA(Asn)/glutamyl-tRNA(Gln) amidotransferase subunit A
MELHQLSITELLERFRSGAASPRDAVESVLNAIQSGDGTIGAYLSIDAEAALTAAENADTALPLGGIPIAIKDAINVEGQNTTCASKFLENFNSPYDATVIAKLKAAGAIPLGKTNMDEFAMGSSTENSALGKTTNPWDSSRIPGGSSGGSAAAVAADLAIAALGSDTGGSIRQPASHCGCVGLKPTYGRVSRFGLVAFASSLDQIGPVTKTAEDAARVLQVIAGGDINDSTCLDDPVPDYLSALNRGVKGLRIGLPKEYFIDGIEPGVRTAVDAAVKELESQGAEIVEISLPHTEYAVATYYIIATAEASANLSRFDGVRYGHRSSKDPESIVEHYKNTRAEGFGEEVKRRVILGTYVLSSGYYDAYYLRAQKVRTLIRQDFAEAFENVDIIASPVVPAPAFKIGENADDPLKVYLEDIFTIAANLAGICGISIPCGLCETEGAKLPVGLQLLGKPLGESDILRASCAFQQNTDWHKGRPGK